MEHKTYIACTTTTIQIDMDRRVEVRDEHEDKQRVIRYNYKLSQS